MLYRQKPPADDGSSQQDFCLGQVHARLAPTLGSSLRQKRRRHLHIGNPAHINRSQKPRHIRPQIAAKGNQQTPRSPPPSASPQQFLQRWRASSDFSPGSRTAPSGASANEACTPRPKAPISTPKSAQKTRRGSLPRILSPIRGASVSPARSRNHVILRRRCVYFVSSARCFDLKCTPRRRAGPSGAEWNPRASYLDFENLRICCAIPASAPSPSRSL